MSISTTVWGTPVFVHPNEATAPAANAAPPEVKPPPETLRQLFERRTENANTLFRYRYKELRFDPPVAVFGMDDNDRGAYTYLRNLAFKHYMQIRDQERSRARSFWHCYLCDAGH